jgi:hypothetical protein
MDPIRNLIADLDNGMSIEEALKKHDAHLIKPLDRELCKAMAVGKNHNQVIRNKVAYYKAKLGIK